MGWDWTIAHLTFSSSSRLLTRLVSLSSWMLSSLVRMSTNPMWSLPPKLSDKENKKKRSTKKEKRNTPRIGPGGSRAFSLGRASCPAISQKRNNRRREVFFVLSYSTTCTRDGREINTREREREEHRKNKTKKRSKQEENKNVPWEAKIWHAIYIELRRPDVPGHCPFCLGPGKRAVCGCTEHQKNTHTHTHNNSLLGQPVVRVEDRQQRAADVAHAQLLLGGVPQLLRRRVGRRQVERGRLGPGIHDALLRRRVILLWRVRVHWRRCVPKLTWRACTCIGTTTGGATGKERGGGSVVS